MQQWEYKFVFVPDDETDEVKPEDFLNQFGDQGWELVALTPVLSSSAESPRLPFLPQQGRQDGTHVTWFRAVFKRPKA
ncbi:MAG TPA: DUF4177 domain-containing protein [Ktedonobacterales bacterium]|nr:DUF4177 domain-containing protein [Ktedonobacterales bacterium]